MCRFFGFVLVQRDCARFMVALLAQLVVISGAQAQIAPESIYDLTSQHLTSLSQLSQKISPGTVVIISEYHDQSAHHRHQVELLKSLQASQRAPDGITVGMEFFSFPDQVNVDQYLLNNISEDIFLKKVNWGALPFDFYREQVQFPPQTGGWTLALNAPAWLTRKVARQGIEALSPEELESLPPQFTPGNSLYYERFAETMKDGHVPEDAIKRYFAAQSIWDDTMAWQAAQYLQQNPNQVVVIIVGDFHAIYGGGLPDRLKARGLHKLTILGQVNLADFSQAEQLKLLKPHVKYGQRADYLWTSLTPHSKSRHLHRLKESEQIIQRLLHQN